ncbi:hypothetical protein F4805DRAFT_454012 [Annulohypoxylon moriforme]|nr:hypothetical protein F4805DRAFT_454012 [Annulohypoxylon moriforme]
MMQKQRGDRQKRSCREEAEEGQRPLSPAPAGPDDLVRLTERVVSARGATSAPDSAISMASAGSPLREAMDDIMNDNRQRQTNTVIVEMDGVRVMMTFRQLQTMNEELARARAAGHFPRTTAPAYDIQATVEDYRRLQELSRVRGSAPPEQWRSMREASELHVRIAQQIAERDEVTGESAEHQRVHQLVANLMNGVDTESRMYGIVQHAVAHAIKKQQSDAAATMTGQSMIEMLKGIRTAINQMGERGAHGVSEHNFEAVLEEVFGMIDHALGEGLGERVQHMDGQINRVDGQIDRVDGQINHVDGQIMHLNAIGQHVNAIDGHVHSLGNNLGAMSVLLNSTNGNITGMTTQIGVLQTIVNMLPQMIQQVLHERLSQALEDALRPLIDLIEAHYGVSIGQIDPATINAQGQSKKSKVKSFFKGIFKRFRKSGH